MTDLLSEQQWWDYEQLGYLRLGSVLHGPELTALQRRMDEIIVGQVHHPALQFQLDAGGRYEDVPDPVPRAGTTLAHRRAQGLEADPLVLAVIRQPVFREICDRHYGKHASISIFRAMMMDTRAIWMAGPGTRSLATASQSCSARPRTLRARGLSCRASGTRTGACGKRLQKLSATPAAWCNTRSVWSRCAARPSSKRSRSKTT